jgi:hypothetical protein
MAVLLGKGVNPMKRIWLAIAALLANISVAFPAAAKIDWYVYVGHACIPAARTSMPSPEVAEIVLRGANRFDALKTLRSPDGNITVAIVSDRTTGEETWFFANAELCKAAVRAAIEKGLVPKPGEKLD